MYKILLLMTLITIMLQDCSILIGKRVVFMASFLMILLLALFIIKRPIVFLRKIKTLYKHTPIKYYIWYLIFIVATALITFNINTIFTSIIRISYIHALVIAPAILLAIVIFPKKISPKTLLRYLTNMNIFILLYGVLDYIFIMCLSIKAPLYNILCSGNYFSHVMGTNLVEDEAAIQRTSSIFFEPSFFATYIFLFLPTIYLISSSKAKIYGNSFINKLVKILLPVLAWVSLFFTKSPIYIIACVIYTLLFFSKNIIKQVKKYRVPIIIGICALLLTFFTITITIGKNSQSNVPVISRINKTLDSFGDLRKLVEQEPSMATRVITTVNTFQASLKHPFIGVGYRNGEEIMRQQWKTTSTPITLEIIEKEIIPDTGGPSSNIFWSHLLYSGFIGVFILYCFLIGSIYQANKIKKYFIGKEGLLLNCVICVAINYIIITFYWSLEYYAMIWFVFGLLNSYILIYKMRMRKKLNAEKYLQIATNDNAKL